MTTRFKRNTGALAAAIALGFAGAQSALAQTSPSGADRSTKGTPSFQATQSSQVMTPARPLGSAATQGQRDMRISQLIGMDVRNAEGKDLGEINDVVVDVDSGKVHYAVLGFGGFLGMGEKLFAFPLSAFQVTSDGDRARTGAATGGAVGVDRTGAATRPTQPGTTGSTAATPAPGTSADASRRAGTAARRDAADLRLVLNVPESRLEDAPGFDKARWPDWNDATYRGEVDKFAAANEARNTVSQQGNLRRASELLDAEVRDGQRADIGDIEDLIVDPQSGQVRYAVVAFERGWTEPDRLVVLPMTALERQQDRNDDDLTFVGDRSRLQQAPGFERSNWPDLNASSFRGSIDQWLAGWGGTTPGAGMTGARDTRDGRSTAATGDGRGATGGQAAPVPPTAPGTPATPR
jgi:sporulation protein YlmC with PRC-barrel domain